MPAGRPTNAARAAKRASTAGGAVRKRGRSTNIKYGTNSNKARTDLFKPRSITMGGPKNKFGYQSRRAPVSLLGKGVLALGQHFVKGLKDKKAAQTYFDASITANQLEPIALPSSLGLSITQNFCNRSNMNLVTTTGISQVFIFQLCDSQCVCFSYTQAATTPLVPAILTPIMFADMATTPPTNMRSSRATFNILNSTAVSSVSGTVSVLQIVNNLEWEFDTSASLAVTAQFQSEIATMITTNSNSKEYTGQDFTSQKKFSLLPSSMSKLQEWRQFTDFTAISTNALKAAHIIESAQNYSHGTLIVKFNAPSVSNGYTIQYNAQYSMRHPSNTILGSLGKKTPSTSEQHIDAVISNAQAASAQGDHDYFMRMD